MPDRNLREYGRANEQRLEALEAEVRQLSRRANPGTAITHVGVWGPNTGKIIPAGRWIVLARAAWAYREPPPGGEVRTAIEVLTRDGSEVHPTASNNVPAARKGMIHQPQLSTGAWPEIQDETQTSGEVISPNEWRVQLRLTYFTPITETPPPYLGAWGARLILLPY